MEAAIATGILSLVAELFKIVTTARNVAAQNKEWTAAEEAAFDAKLSILTSQPHWQVTP
jgi:hypothetical protein